MSERIWCVHARYVMPMRDQAAQYVHEHIVAFCATKAMAVAEAARLVDESDGSDCAPAWEQPAYYVRQGVQVALIGLESR